MPANMSGKKLRFLLKALEVTKETEELLNRLTPLMDEWNDNLFSANNDNEFVDGDFADARVAHLDPTKLGNLMFALSEAKTKLQEHKVNIRQAMYE